MRNNNYLNQTYTERIEEKQGSLNLYSFVTFLFYSRITVYESTFTKHRYIKSYVFRST